jgi:hypothetical protein
MNQESCVPQSTAQIPIAQSPGTEGLFNFVPPGKPKLRFTLDKLQTALGPLPSFAKNKRELGAGEGGKFSYFRWRALLRLAENPQTCSLGSGRRLK